MFISDLIVVDAELITKKLNIFCDYYQKFKLISKNYFSIKKCFFNLSSYSTQFYKKIIEFDRLMPELINMYELELSFKNDSIIEFSFSNDKDMFSSIISSWVYGVYIESSIISCLCSLTI